MKQALILASGKGTRLAERLNGRPKPLIDVDGVPLLERQALSLARNGVEDVVVLVDHAAVELQAWFAERVELGCRVRLIDNGGPLGTAGAALACIDELQDQFLVVHGDTLFNIDIAKFVTAHENARADVTLFLQPNDHPHDSDLVEVDEAGAVLAFHSRPHPPGAVLPNLVSPAFYAIQREALTTWRDFRTPSDLAKDLFPAMLQAGARIHAYRSFEYIKDLGAPERLDEVIEDLRSGVVSRASLTYPQTCVFLDRDGTLNEQRDFVRSPEELVLLPGAGEAVRMFNAAEHRVAVVTNQPVIARGEVTVAGLRTIHAKLDGLLGEHGAYVDTLRYCPHHPDSGFPGEIAALKIQCECRKPGAKLLRDAAEDLNADLSRSWVVGDSTADIGAALKLGLYSVLVRTGNGGRDGKHPARPDFIVDDVLEAARLITSFHPRIERAVAGFLPSIRAGDLILVGGLACTGKTTLAASLSALLRRRGLAAQTISLDCWLRPAAERGDGGLARFDLPEAARALSPWLSGGVASFTAAIQSACTRAAGEFERIDLRAEEVLVLEGAPALAMDWRTERPIRKIYVEADAKVRAARVIEGIVRRGLGDQDEARRAHESQMRDEAPVVEATRAKADLVLRLEPTGARE